MAAPKEGKPIWVESTLSDKEYKEAARMYPNTFTNGNTAPAMFDCEFKWRYKMGAQMTPQEITVFNKRLAELAEVLRKIQEQDGETVQS